MTYEEAVQAMNTAADVYNTRTGEVVNIDECVIKTTRINGERRYAHTFLGGDPTVYMKPIEYLENLSFIPAKEDTND